VDVGMDKVKDSMRDPQAEAAKKKAEDQKIAEGFQKALSVIDARRELSPLQREKLTMAFKKQFAQVQQLQQFVQIAEASQKTKRAEIFTGAGLLGVVGEAALNTPSVMMARADVMSKSPTMRAQTNAAIQQADILSASGTTQSQAQRAIAQVDVMSRVGALQAETKGAIHLTEIVTIASSTSQVVEQRVVLENTLAENATPPIAPEQSKDAFSPDIGKKIYVEFVGSTAQTKVLKDLLLGRGHMLVDKKSDADIVYLLEGEYVIAENKQHKGLNISVGQLLDDPAKPIEKPEAKIMGSVGAGLSKFIFAVAQAQGANVPTTALPKEINGFRQQVLLVTARQPKGGAETRFSVVQEVESPVLDGVLLAKSANEEMHGRLGLPMATN
jgi:hypothetical protein